LPSENPQQTCNTTWSNNPTPTLILNSTPAHKNKLDYVKKNKERLEKLKANLDPETLRQSIYEFTRPSSSFDPSVPESEDERNRRLQTLYTLDQANARSYAQTREHRGDTEFSLLDLAHENAWQSLSDEPIVDSHTETNSLFAVLPELSRIASPVATAKMIELINDSLTEIASRYTPSTWVPVAVTVVTYASLMSIWSAWQKNSKPGERLSDQKLRDMHAWETAAAESLVKAANHVREQEETLKSVKEEKELLQQQLSDLQNLQRANPGREDEFSDVLDGIKNGLKDTAGRLKGLEHIPRVKMMKDHIELLSRLASGKAPAGTRIDKDAPLPEEIIHDIKNNGRSTNGFPQPSFKLDNDGLPPSDPMDYEFTTPARPTQDKFMEVKAPFEYDGSPLTWTSWNTSVKLYISDNRGRFRSALAVLDVINAATKEGTRAKSQMTHLTNNIFLDGTIESIEFEALKQPVQVFHWVMNRLAPFFQNGTLTSSSLKKLRHQQRNESIVVWMQELDEARMALGMTYESLLPFVLTGINQTLAAYISTKVNKTVNGLSWNDLLQWGGTCEEELKSMHAPSYFHAKPIVRGHAASVTSVGKTYGPAPTVSSGRRLSDADFELLKNKRACGNCFCPGHGKANCKAPRAEAFTNEHRLRLIASVSRSHPPVPGRQAFVPASNNPYAASVASSDTPSSAGNSTYQTPSVSNE
jgi:hypothetical protein